MVLPTFVIVGAQKAGTTSLWKVVASHPDVARPNRKEVHFFDRKFDKGVDWYSGLFTLKPGQTQAGESTPIYMYDPVVRRRMIDTLPDIKVVITLRDPVSRAYSHYWHTKRHGFEPHDTFEAAVAAEPERLANAGIIQRGRWSYLDRGRYVGQLQALEQAYGRAAMCITTLEEMIADSPVQISKVLRHIDLDPARMESLALPHANPFQTITPKERRRRIKAGEPLPDDLDVKYPPLGDETRAKLREEFAADDARLLEWLGWDRLPWTSLANA